MPSSSSGTVMAPPVAGVPVPSDASFAPRDEEAPLLLRAARSVAAAGRAHTVVDVLHARALRHYAEGLEQFLALRLGSVEAAELALRKVRVVVAAHASDELVRPPGIRARLYRIAREIAAREREANASVPPTTSSLPYREGAGTRRHAKLEALRDALTAEQSELLELRHARELRPTEIAFVLERDVAEVLEALHQATERASQLVLEAPGDRLRALLLDAFALRARSATVREHEIPAGPAPLVPGALVGGRYRVQARVGTGAFGDVYRAEDVEVPGHVVALKLLHQASPSDEERERALRELRLIASVFHPSVVQFKDHGWHEGRLWFVMPWYEGETLEDRIEREPLTRQEARTIFEPLARALASMHARGIRHQDIKPENIFLAKLPGDDAPLPVLLDLGVAAEDAEMIFAGTPTYFAPEVACQFASVPDKPPVGHAADVFALALALRNALEPSTQEDIPANAVETFIEARARSVPALPRNPQLRFLDASLRRWTALDPEDRPTAAELADELSVLTLPEVRRAHRRRSLAVALPITLMVALAAGATYQQFRQRELARAMGVARAERAAESLRGSLVDTQAHVAQLRGRVEEGAFTRQELQASLAAHGQRLNASEGRVVELTNTVSELRSTAETLTSTLEERRARVVALERELLAAQQQVGTLGQRLDERRQEAVAQQAALDDTRRQLRDVRSAEADARAAAETQAELAAAERARAEALAASIARLQREQVRLSSERQQAEAALRTAEEELRALRRARSSTPRPSGGETPPDGAGEGAEGEPSVTPQQAPPPAA
ncbi:MAG: protein kinase [Myxococcales bacterium]|nr:protein kinase [Myxococcales bacterium]